MALRLAWVVPILALAGCGAPSMDDLCRATDWHSVKLREGVGFDAVEQVFLDEGWTIADAPEENGIRAESHRFFRALKEEPSKEFNATVTLQETGAGWRYLHVSIFLHSRSATDTVPVPRVQEEAPGLLARLQGLGAESRSPTPWPTGSSGDWDCVQI